MRIKKEKKPGVQEKLVSVRTAKGKEILRALDGLLQAAKKLLQVLIFFHEIDFGSFNDEEIRALIAEEEMFVGARHFLNILRGNLTLLLGFFLGDAAQQHFRLGLEVDDQVGIGEFDCQGLVIALVQFEFLVVKAEVGKDAVFLHQKVAQDQTGGIGGKSFTDALLPLHQEVHLSAESGAGEAGIKIGEKGIIFTIVDAARVKTFSEEASERGFANAERAFNNDESRWLRATLRDACAFRG
jgi:hypothetical protein